ncbi:unnamed protein product [Ostreobium quekettii]|uniref:Protein kinase domain-containing protein n=1 Tax=Ostreobium quekettii TaxID=121088 RepID=A0A8S1J9N5_9CHLO|nr:unnamed protein product [Ostreobium quekettii]|eukprot:evm.model.scf_1710.4 EVM.evm.TU.scf_1710.4   scf_1710:24332-27311(-)
MAPHAMVPPNYFDVVRHIDDGKSSSVYHCRDVRESDPSAADVAIKFIPRGPETIDERVLREVLIVRKLQHKHIVRFREAHLNSRHLCLVFDYVPGGNLEQFVDSRGGTLPEHLARYFFQQLVLGMDFLHRVPPYGIMNRDLKLRNILVDDPTSEFPILSICDFGFGKERDPCVPTVSAVGTPFYFAPEILYRSSWEMRYDGKMTDIHGMGVILYKMLYGEFPEFNETGGETLEEKLLQLKVNTTKLDKSPPSLRALMLGLLEPVPSQRWSVDKVFKNEWFCLDLEEGSAALRQYNDAMLAQYNQWEDSRREVQSVERLKMMVNNARAEAL